jgi:perosamine synthetase
LIDINDIKNKITRRTTAIIAVDYAGQPCDYDALRKIAEDYGLAIVADACHSLGGSYKNRPVGSLADLNVFSLHPVKHITTGEGGVVASDNSYLMERVRSFRNHGIALTHSQRTSWFYEMTDLGYNYRLTDIQCALGISQLCKLDSWIDRRREIANTYDYEIQSIGGIAPLRLSDLGRHAYHLYVVQLDLDRLIWIKQLGRAKVYKALWAEGIGVNVHYIPVHLHPYYRLKLGTSVGLAPVAEAAYERILSLPIFPAMTEENVDDVLYALQKVMGEYTA